MSYPLFCIDSNPSGGRLVSGLDSLSGWEELFGCQEEPDTELCGVLCGVLRPPVEDLTHIWIPKIRDDLFIEIYLSTVN